MRSPEGCAFWRGWSFPSRTYTLKNMKRYWSCLLYTSFMIQGGCPDGTGMGGPGYSIRGEFSANGFNNPIKHTRGVISMARSMNPDSAGSQFFIMHEDAPHLDGQYAAFGRVVEGMEVVDEIANTPTGRNDRPHTPQVMQSVVLVED